MFTVGRNHLDILALYDWTVLTGYARHRQDTPAVLMALLDDPVAVDPTDLANIALLRI